MSTPALPDLCPSIPDGQDVTVELRLLYSTGKAYKVAAPFNGPDSAAGVTAWLPASMIHLGGHAGRFNCYQFHMRAGTYRRLRREMIRRHALAAGPAAVAATPTTA